MTARRVQVLEFLRRYQAMHGMSPSVQDVADELSVCINSAWAHLHALEVAGKIRRLGQRQIEILESALQRLGGAMSGYPAAWVVVT